MCDANKALVRRHFEETFNQRRTSAADLLLAEDFLEHAAGPFGGRAPGRVHGPTAIRQVVAGLVAQFPDLHMRIEDLVAEGDMVVARVRTSGTHLGPLGCGIPPTGRRFESLQAHWFRVQGSRLAEHWAMREDLAAMLQLGVIRAPG
jgi:predicted ester cyclase